MFKHDKSYSIREVDENNGAIASLGHVWNIKESNEW